MSLYIYIYIYICIYIYIYICVCVCVCLCVYVSLLKMLSNSITFPLIITMWKAVNLLFLHVTLTNAGMKTTTMMTLMIKTKKKDLIIVILIATGTSDMIDVVDWLIEILSSFRMQKVMNILYSMAVILCLLWKPTSGSFFIFLRMRRCESRHQVFYLSEDTTLEFLFLLSFPFLIGFSEVVFWKKKCFQ